MKRGISINVGRECEHTTELTVEVAGMNKIEAIGVLGSVINKLASSGQDEDDKIMLDEAIGEALSDIIKRIGISDEDEEMKYMMFCLLRDFARTGEITELNPSEESKLEEITEMLKTEDIRKEATDKQWESINYAYRNRENDTMVSIINEQDMDDGTALIKKVFLFKATNIIVINGVNSLMNKETGEVNGAVMGKIKKAFFGCEMIHHVIYLTGQDAYLINTEK